MPPDEREILMRDFIDAFARNDLGAMGTMLSECFIGHITTTNGGTRDVTAAEYLDGVAAMGVPSAALRLALPDVTLVGANQVMVMVEVHAERRGRSLHNFSGQLATIDSGTISELWMVEALPARSDAFWST